MSRFVYLHGFASAPTSKKAQFFLKRFRERGIELAVPALDGGDFKSLTITGQLRVVENAVAGEPVTLIGSSLGGYLAALYAARHPEVQRLVLLAPAFHFPHRWPSALGSETMAAWKQSGILKIFHYGASEECDLGYQLIEDALQYEDEPSAGQPTLILHGKNDQVVPVQLSVSYAERRPNVKLLIFECGHEMTEVLDQLWDEVSKSLAL